MRQPHALPETHAVQLASYAKKLRSQENALANREIALKPALNDLVLTYPDRTHAAQYDRELEIVVDPVRARFSAWYEFFPRSASQQPGKHGTFADCEARLPYVAGMGFDVVYFPPIHPIGFQFRKGKNNTVTAQPDDVGSPWAIGASTGGHKSILAELGTLEDFRRLVGKACGSWHPDRPRHRLPGRARSSIRQRARKLVSKTSRWNHSVRRESSEEVSGHLSL